MIEQKQQSMLVSGRTLAEATTKVVEAAKTAARRPDDVASQVREWLVVILG